MSVKFGISSATAIAVDPIADTYFDDLIPIEPEHSRSSDGTARRANEPKFRRWEFEVGFVTASNASIIQSWYTSQASLLFWEDDALYPNSAYPVFIMNPNKPLNKWAFPYYNIYREGVLVFEANSAE